MQNKIAFLPVHSGRCLTNDCTSGVGRISITGVPIANRSKSPATEGSGKEAKSKTGAFNNSDMASAKRLVLPVREMYRKQAFTVSYSNRSSYNLCLTCISHFTL